MIVHSETFGRSQGFIGQELSDEEYRLGLRKVSLIARRFITYTKPV